MKDDQFVKVCKQFTINYTIAIGYMNNNEQTEKGKKTCRQPSQASGCGADLIFLCVWEVLSCYS